MRTLLEKAIVHLLNDEKQEAEALFHRFLVGRARQIHESLRQGDESIMDESWNNEDMMEEYFTDDDLSGLEDSEDAVKDDEHADTALDDAADDLTAATDDVEDAAADADDAADLGEPADDASSEDDLTISPEDAEAVKDELQDLLAKFDQLMSDDSDDVDAGDLPVDEPADDMGDLDASDEGDKAEDETVDGGLDDKEDGHVEDDEDDFADIAESIASELQKISIDLTDGKEVGAGKAIDTNKKSGLTQKKAEASDAHPFELKSQDHTGFEREEAPAPKMQKKARNTLSKADDGRSTISKDGDKGALLNKDFAGK